MTPTLASERGDRGVRVNCIAPGPAETESAEALWPTSQDRERVLSSVPSGRFASTEEVAETAIFLLDERSALVSGEVLVVDGGQWLGRDFTPDPAIAGTVEGEHSWRG